MRNVFLKFLFLMLSVCTLTVSKGQSKDFENVVDVKLERTITILNNNTIVGYALFYKVDKMKKAALYRLEILDENLKSIGSNEFEGSKELMLINAVYESEHIMLAFSDEKKTDGYEKFVKIYDMKGKETGNIPYDPDKVKRGMYGKMIAENMAEYYNGYGNVEGKGFVCAYPSEAKTGGSNIQMIDKSGKLKWEKELTADKGDRMDMYMTASTPNAIIFFCGIRGGAGQRDSKNYLLGLDANTGNELYRTPLEVDSYAWEPMFVKNDAAGNYKMVSTLTHEEDKFYSARPIGFNIADLNDKTGQLKVVKNFLFDKDLTKVLDMKSESKSEEGYLAMHDICLMPDGSSVLVGEFFRRTVSAAGMAMKIISRGGGTASQITIGDLFLLHMDQNNNASSLDKISKDPVRIPAIADGVSLGLTQRIMKVDHDFGYQYTDETPDQAQRTVVVNGSFDDEKYGTSAITFDSKKGFKIKKFTIEKVKKETVYILRGKPGHVLVMKYNSKEKKISLNLERTS